MILNMNKAGLSVLCNTYTLLNVKNQSNVRTRVSTGAVKQSA